MNFSEKSEGEPRSETLTLIIHDFATELGGPGLLESNL